jgi:hypothetical protein
MNDGALSTSLRGVTLHFFFEEPGEAEVMVSNDAAFPGATWVSYTETLSWTLSSTLQYSGAAEVFVRFRDAALNESPDVAGDSILYLGHGVYLPVVLRNDTP